MIRPFAAVMVLLTVPVLGWVRAAQADDVMSETHRLAAESGGVAIVGRLHEANANSYILSADAGQRLIVSFASSSPHVCLDLIAPDGAVLYDGSSGNTSIDMTLPVGGDFRLQVALADGAAGRGDRADYRLTVRLSGGP